MLTVSASRAWAGLGITLTLIAAQVAHAEPSRLQTVPARGTLRVGMSSGLSPFVVDGKDVDELLSKVATQGTLPPVHTLADGRRVAGFDVELAHGLALRLGVKLEIVLVDKFEDLLPGLAANRYDIAISELTRTLDRARNVSFSDPYFSSGIEVLVRDSKRFENLLALNQKGVRVAFRAGTTAEAFAALKLVNVERIAITERGAMFAAIDDPKIDAVVVDALWARDADVRGRTKASLHALEERRFTVEHIAIASPLGDPDWLNWLNLFVRDAKATGALHAYAARYNDWFRTER